MWVVYIEPAGAPLAVDVPDPGCGFGLIDDIRVYRPDGPDCRWMEAGCLRSEVRCLVTGATGYIGGRLVPRAARRGSAPCGRWRATRTSSPTRRGATDVEVVARRPRRPRLADRGVRRRRRRLLPGAFDGHVDGFRRRGGAVGAQRRRRGASGRCAAAGVPVAACIPTGRRSVPHLRSRTAVGDILHRLRHRDRRAAGRDRHRLGFGVVRDDPAPHRPAAGDDDAEVGAQQDPADRDRRRAALPARGRHGAGAGVAHLGRRRSGRDGVRRGDAGLRRGRRACDGG